jgi:hypothetical protein
MTATGVLASTYNVNGNQLFEVDVSGRLVYAQSLDIVITGTADQIDVTNGSSVMPVISISPTYVGQTSITTLGTVRTGYVARLESTGILSGGV